MGALSALGIELEKPAFPAVVQCPLCQQTALHLFDDITTDGIWLHCDRCAAHGDIITFGALIWNTSLPAALTRFADLGLVNSGDKDNLAGQYDRGLRRQLAVENFWCDAEAQIWNHGDDVIACRLRELGVGKEICADGLVGVAHHDQIVNLCSEVGRPKPTKLRADGASIVFPFYDLPGRPTGVLVVQYAEDFATKSTFIPTSGYTRQRPEAGYFLLKTATLPGPELLKSSQFVVDDPFWALRAQCKQRAHGLDLLPIMASYNGPEATSYGPSWLAFPPIPRMFHGNTITPELVSRACHAKGYVCVTPLAPAARVREAPAITTLAEIRRSAATWQNSLQKTLRGMNEISAYSFASRLMVPHDKLQHFLLKCDVNLSATFASRVITALAVAPTAPTKAHRRWVIVEKDNSWWNQLGHQICSARPVIKKIIQADNGEKLYSGTIYIKNDALEFCDTATKIERMGLLSFAAAHAAPHGKLIVFDRAWNRRSHLLAIQLHQPELIMVSGRAGWDEYASVFRFAQYELGTDGEITLANLLQRNRSKISFPEPTPVAPPAIRQFLTPSYENSFIWTVFAGITAQLLAPVLRKDSAAIGIVGANFNAAVRIAAALNCAHIQYAGLRKSHNAQQLVKASNESDWPLLASNAFDDTVFSAAVTRCHNLPVTVRLTPTCAAIATGYGWQLINGTAPAANTDFSVLQHVLPAYIQRTLRSRMSLAAQTGTLTEVVLRDLHRWLDETYGTAFHLPCALNKLVSPKTAHITLMGELNNAIQLGKLAVLPRPRNKQQAYNYLLRRADNWWLNRRAIDRYFELQKSAPPNWLAIIELLSKAGLFSGEEIVQNMPGILVPTGWCDKFWQDPQETTTAQEIG